MTDNGKIMLGVLGATVLGTVVAAVVTRQPRVLRGPRKARWQPTPGTPEHAAHLRALPNQRYVEGKWTSLRQGESVTIMIIETPEGDWRARVDTDDGTWSARGPDPDNAAHYADGDTKDVDGNDKTVIATAKKRARQYIKDQIK